MASGFDFNREMDDYISSKRKKSRDSGFMYAKEADEEKETLMATYPKTYGGRKPFFSIAGIIDKLKTKKVRLSSKQEAELEDELETEFVQEYSSLDADEQRAVDEEKEILVEKRSLVKEFVSKLKFLKTMIRSDDEYEEYEDVSPGQSQEYDELRGELKEISKITVSLMKRLPKKELNDFKVSEDFLRFKETLRKYDLIVEK